MPNSKAVRFAAPPDAVQPLAAAARIQIHSFEDLRKIGTEGGYPLDGGYELAADIDASPSRERGFSPIGTADAPFTGVFNGKGRCISGLCINLPELNHVGLFGYAQNAEIRGVRLSGVSVTGCLDVGALVGFAEFAIIDGCGSAGDVSGGASVGGLVGSASAAVINACGSSCVCRSAGYRSDSWHWSSVGGLVGHAQGGTAIIGCRAAGDVSGAYNNVGGLLGFAGSVDISRCCSTGGVRGGDHDVGGFVGNIAGTMGRNVISDCYSTGDVCGSDRFGVGGFVGNVDSRDASIRSCYSAGRVSGGGGFSPPVYYDAMSACFWDVEASGCPPEVACGNVSAKSTAQMKRRETFAGWDFDAVWAMDAGGGYPKLRGVGLRPNTP